MFLIPETAINTPHPALRVVAAEVTRLKTPHSALCTLHFRGTPHSYGPD
jgi:hypothetical protein